MVATMPLFSIFFLIKMFHMNLPISKWLEIFNNSKKVKRGQQQTSYPHETIPIISIEEKNSFHPSYKNKSKASGKDICSQQNWMHTLAFIHMRPWVLYERLMYAQYRPCIDWVIITTPERWHLHTKLLLASSVLIYNLEHDFCFVLFSNSVSVSLRI